MLQGASDEQKKYPDAAAVHSYPCEVRGHAEQNEGYRARGNDCKITKNFMAACRHAVPGIELFH